MGKKNSQNVLHMCKYDINKFAIFFSSTKTASAAKYTSKNNIIYHFIQTVLFYLSMKNETRLCN